MNKTIIININGIVFHIEEDAYEVLKGYMTDVKRHFMDSADSLEITTDIENRLAEMFNEILARDNKQVIVEADVQAVIAQMGTVEDFASADEDEKASAKNTFNYATETRRLFRDPDDHLAAGVCSGIANYFDIQAVWIRLAFALAFCFFGTGLFLYIILWIVIPKATTRADRMAMKGEKLNLQGFARNFEDELKGAQSHLGNLHNEVKPLIYKTRDFAGDFFDHLRIFLHGAGKVFAKILGVLIMLTCIGLTIALVVTVFIYFAYGKNDLRHLPPFSMINDEYTFPFVTGAFLLLAIPLVSLTLGASQMVFNRSAFNRTSGFTMLSIWVVSLFVVLYYSIEVAAQFRAGGSISQTVSIKATPNNTYYLKLNNIRHLTPEDSARLDLKSGFTGKIILDDDSDFDGDLYENGSRNVSIDIERSDVSQPILVESFSSRGRNYADALMNARNTSYQFTQVDSVLMFDRHLQKIGRRPARGQEVRLTLKVPVNAKLVIEDDLGNYLRDVNIWQCQEDNKIEHNMPVTFLMTSTGLQCKVDTLVTKRDSIIRK